MQQPRPARPSTQRASLDAMHLGRAADFGGGPGEPCPPQQFWEQLAAARERVRAIADVVPDEYCTCSLSTNSTRLMMRC
jgi:hypothetical protein